MGSSLPIIDLGNLKIPGQRRHLIARRALIAHRVVNVRRLSRM